MRIVELVRAAAIPLLLSGLGASPASGFSVFIGDSLDGSVASVLTRAGRWDADPSGLRGLDGGLEVHVAADFGAVLGVTDPAELDLLDQTIVAAFRAWESPVLTFDITLGGPAVENANVGGEIDVFAVPGDHYIFGGGSAFGYADVVSTVVQVPRLLTNGMQLSGYRITGADVFINADNVRFFAELAGLTLEQQSQALQRLLMHEIGHALGLAHVNQPAYSHYDFDDDPHDPEVVDPLDPFTGLQRSSVRPTTAILSNALSSGPALFFTELQNDDRLGRDVLYPAFVPEPSLATLLALAAVLRAGRGRAVLRP